MKIYKYKLFHQWARSEKLKDETLREAIDEIEEGLYEANLGGGLYKKRVAMSGQGKRSSYRTLLAFKKGEKAFFIYGFAKNVLDNISENEKKVYRRLAKEFLTLKEQEIQKLLNSQKLFEVK